MNEATRRGQGGLVATAAELSKRARRIDVHGRAYRSMPESVQVVRAASISASTPDSVPLYSGNVREKL